mgnify:CR=1 FL=1
MNNKYNGWTNYETWNCKLWLDNEQTPNEMISEHIAFLRENREAINLLNHANEKKTKSDIIYKLSQFIKDQLIEPYTPELKPSMYSDMLSASLREINYHEIATAYYDDLWQWVDEAQKNRIEGVQHDR